MKKLQYDIVAGIPSFNNQETISFVTEQIGKAFEKYCKDKKCLLIDCDGGSTDNTIQQFFNAQTNIAKRVFVSTPGTTGKGNVFRLLFRFSKLSKAKAIIVNDADLKSINSDWIRLQLDSIQKHGLSSAPSFRKAG